MMMVAKRSTNDPWKTNMQERTIKNKIQLEEYD